MTSKEWIAIAAGNAEVAARCLRREPLDSNDVEKALGRLWDAISEVEMATGRTPPVIVSGTTADALRRDLGSSPGMKLPRAE